MLLLSMGLFFNLFTTLLMMPKSNSTMYLSLFIMILFLTLMNLFFDFQYWIGTLLLFDGSISINSMILLQEMSILMFALLILINYMGFNLKMEYYLILFMN